MSQLTIDVNLYGETYTVYPEFHEYSNGRLAIPFRLVDTGEPYGVLTVNLPDQHLNEGEVFVKDWAEGEPLFAAVRDAGWIELTGREVGSGYVTPPVAKLAGDLFKAYKERTNDPSN